jgi:hypothetical protein
MAREDRPAARPKPTLAQLGVDLAALEWQRSGSGDGSFEVAFVRGQVAPSEAPGAGGDATRDGRAGQDAEWVLLRVAGDPAGRVLVYDRVEWACFLDGARSGEFDPGNRGADPAA